MAQPRGRTALREAARIERDAWQDLYAAPTPGLAEELGIGGTRQGAIWMGWATRLAILEFQRPLGMGMMEPAGQGVLDSVIRRYRDAGAGAIFLPLSRVAELPGGPALLGQRGFRLHDHWRKFVRRPGNMPGPRDAPRVERISADRAHHFGRIVSRAFGWTADVAPWLAAAVGRAGWSHYLALDGGTPIAAASMFADRDAAWLGFAGTLEEHRGRGAQSALLARRIRDATDLGCRLLTIETGETEEGEPGASGRNVVRMGFRQAYRRPNWLLEL